MSESSLVSSEFVTLTGPTLTGHQGPVLSIRFTRDGDYCLSTGKDRSIRLWNPHKRLHITEYRGHGYEVRDVTVEADNSKFISCGGDKHIFLWDVSTGKVMRKFRGHTSEVNSVCYSSNCNIFVSGGYDQTIRVWDCRSRSTNPIQVVKVCQDCVMSVRCLETGDILAGSVDGTVRRFDIRKGSIVTDLVHHPVTNVDISKDGRYTLASCMDGCNRLLDSKSGQLLGTYRGHAHSCSKIESIFSPDESKIIGGSEDGGVFFWDLLDGNVVEKLQGHSAAVTSLSITETMMATSSIFCHLKQFKIGALVNSGASSARKRIKNLLDQNQGKILKSKRTSSGLSMKPSGNYHKLDMLSRYRTKFLVGLAVVFFTATCLLPKKFFGTISPAYSGAPGKVKTATDQTGSRDSSYAIVIDAGSTGSRIHIFRFLNVAGELELEFDEFDQLKPGLSSYADKPEDAAKSLKPLLDKALSTVPKSVSKSTPIMVGATAGLRLLPDGKADIILDHVRNYLEKYPFSFTKNDVKILSGQNEGAFSWLTLNYLLGNLGKPYDQTVASIDLGGGSVQQAFAMSPTEMKDAPEPDYITSLRGGGKKYSVYVHSYLGYGLMAARAAVLEIDPNGPEDDSHPCIHEGFKGKYTYGSEVYVAEGKETGAQYDQCMATVLSALKKDENCGAPQPQCSFRGAWRGPRIPDVFYVSSYFWDRAADAGLLDDEKDTHAVVSPKHFKSLAEDVCDLDVHSVKKTYDRIQEEHSPYFCLDLTYAHTLLTGGFNIPEEQEITLVKKVKYKGDYVEVAWALGAAINMLS